METKTTFGTKVSLKSIIPDTDPIMIMCEIPHLQRKSKNPKNDSKPVYLSVQMSDIKKTNELLEWVDKEQLKPKSSDASTVPLNV